MNWLTSFNPRLIGIGIFLLRITIGVILFVAGAGKALGWFGGIGMKTTLQFFKNDSGISPFWAYVSTYAELIGGFLLIIGLFTRFSALVLTINMLVAVIVVGTKNFFMGGGAYPFTLMIGCLLILLSGPMQYSIDYLLARNRDIKVV
ncbi:MAG TPA: DoxX family protein [Chitinophagaceae bacterium]